MERDVVAPERKIKTSWDCGFTLSQKEDLYIKFESPAASCGGFKFKLRSYAECSNNAYPHRRPTPRRSQALCQSP